MRLIEMTGGLGSQMFTYAMYLGMRQQFGDDVRIDITNLLHDHEHHGYELHKAFLLPPCEFHTNRILKKVLVDALFRIVLERHQHGCMDAYRKPMHWPWIYYKGLYQNEQYFLDVENEVREAFTFDDSKFSDRTRLCLEHLQRDPRAVSIHVRRGNYTLPKYWPSMGQYASTAYFLNAIESMSKLMPGAHYYVFSDDLQWVRDNLPLESANFIDWNTGEDSWQDMMLMSNCRHNIISNSTFSWWAAWLNDHPDKIVMAPRQWSATQPATDLVPDSWLLIENVPSKDNPTEGAQD